MPGHTLIARFCACGCGKQWRTVTTSPNWFWNEAHAKIARVIGSAEAKQKAKELLGSEQAPAFPGKGLGMKPSAHTAVPVFAEERMEERAAVDEVVVKDEGFEF